MGEKILLSPFEEAFWNKYGRPLDFTNSLKPWDASCAPAIQLRNYLDQARRKFKFLKAVRCEDEKYDEEKVNNLLVRARKIYNDKKNTSRHQESLDITFRALWNILSEEPLVEQVQAEIKRSERSDTKLKLLAEALVLWHKNSAWLGVTEQEPFSSLRLVSDRIWIYRYGLGDYETAVKVTSTLAYGLRRRGRWAGAMECLRWALQQDISDAAKRDLAGALAGLLAELGEHREAIEQYRVCAELDERLAATKDSQALRDGTLALSLLSMGQFHEGEAQIKKALKDLKQLGHVGFQLQLLSRLAEHYIGCKRILKAEHTVNEALGLLENHPDTYDGQRRRFIELKDFLDARKRLREIVRKDRSPVFELVGGAADALENNQRVNALVFIVAALETITLAIWLGKKDQISGNRTLAEKMQRAIGKQNQLKRFPPAGEWKELGYAPDLEAKNWVLHELGAYDSDSVRNDEIFDWIKKVRNNCARASCIGEG